MLFGALGQVYAGYFYFEPVTKSVKPDTEFEILLKANTEGDAIITTDARIDYDASAVAFVDLVTIPEAELFFPKMFNRLIGNSIYIASYIVPAKPPATEGQPRVGDGKIALIRMKAKKVGTTNLTIRCIAGQTTDSNMTLKRNGKVTDVIDCSKVKSAQIMIGTGTNPTPTATPTATPTPTGTVTPTPTPTATPTSTTAPTSAPQATVTPTPSVLPETGSLETIQMVIAVGVTLTVISYLIKIYVS